MLARELGVAALRNQLTSRELTKLNLFNLVLPKSAKTFEGKFRWAVWVSSRFDEPGKGAVGGVRQ